MTSRRQLTTFPLLLTTLILQLFDVAVAAQRPNIVIIVADDLVSATSCYSEHIQARLE